MLYLQALAIYWTLFRVDSLLLTEDMLCQKLPVAGKSQYLLNQQSYFRKNGDSVKTERNSSHRRTKTEPKLFIGSITGNGYITEKMIA